MSDYKVMWSYFNLQGMSGSPWGSNLTSVVSFAQEKGILTNIFILNLININVKQLINNINLIFLLSYLF